MKKYGKTLIIIGVVGVILALLYVYGNELRFQFHKATNTTMYGPELDKQYEELLRERDVARANLESMRNTDHTYMSGGLKDWTEKMNTRQLALQRAEASVRVFPEELRLPTAVQNKSGRVCTGMEGNFRYDWSKLDKTYMSEKERADKSEYPPPCSSL